MRYLSNRLTDFGEIWYGDAYYASQSDGRPKISKFQNPRWRTAAILKIKKSRYLQKRLADFDKILHDDTYLSSRAYQLFKKIKF